MQQFRDGSIAADYLHLNEEEIARYCGGTASPDEKRSIDHHIAICGGCRDRLKRALQKNNSTEA
ncbi:MAG TPA: zf-HC2 domain-containing protein [Bryobacteraceae bacterium]|nr:zf-HC2 domain-containing protein [Bryobacteraceae bacterium]